MHGAVLLTLIVAQRLVEQVVGVGVDCKLLLLSPGVAGVEVEIVHVAVVAVESTAGAHLVDERRSEVVRQTEAQSTLLEEERGIGSMLRRACHLHVVAVLDAEALIEVARGAVSVGVVAVEAEAFQGWCDETEVALISHFHTIHTGVVGVDVLSHLKLLVGIVARESEVAAQVFVGSPLHVHVLDVLIEESQAHQSHTLEVVVGREVDVERSCRLGVRIADGSLLVGNIEGLVGDKCGILRTRDGLGDGGSEASVVRVFVLQQEAWQKVCIVTLDVAGGLHGWVAVLGNVHIVAAGLQVGTLHAQTQGG